MSFNFLSFISKPRMPDRSSMFGHWKLFCNPWPSELSGDVTRLFGSRAHLFTRLTKQTARERAWDRYLRHERLQLRFLSLRVLKKFLWDIGNDLFKGFATAQCRGRRVAVERLRKKQRCEWQSREEISQRIGAGTREDRDSRACSRRFTCVSHIFTLINELWRAIVSWMH